MSIGVTEGGGGFGGYDPPPPPPIVKQNTNVYLKIKIVTILLDEL